MDALLLALALRSVGERLTFRICAGAAFGTVYALMCAMLPFVWLRALPMQGVVMLLMLLTAAGRAADKPRLIAAMAAMALLMGGLLLVGIKGGGDVIALVLPLLFLRPVLMLGEFFRKKG